MFNKINYHVHCTVLYWRKLYIFEKTILSWWENVGSSKKWKYKSVQFSWKHFCPSSYPTGSFAEINTQPLPIKVNKALANEKWITNKKLIFKNAQNLYKEFWPKNIYFLYQWHIYAGKKSIRQKHLCLKYSSYSILYTVQCSYPSTGTDGGGGGVNIFFFF